MKEVFATREATELHIVKALLEAQGLEAVTRNENVWTLGESTRSDIKVWPSLWIVDDACETAARRVIEGYNAAKAERPGRRRVWRCLQCGETLEEQFTACWNCGAEQPD